MKDQVREYQKRFVRLTLGIFSLALCAAFFVLALFMQHQYTEHIEIGMRQAIQNPPQPFRISGEIEEDSNPAFDEIVIVSMGPGGRPNAITGRVLYEPEVLESMVREAQAAARSFGALKGQHTFYCRDLGPDGGARIAFLSMRSFRTAFCSLTVPMAVVLCAAVLLMVPVCQCLSRSAVQPLEEALLRQRQFTTDISHNLKTPLTAIMANENTLRRTPNKTVGEQLCFLDNIRTAGGYMSGLISSMLELARVEEGSDKEPKTLLDLSFLTNKVCLQLDALAFERGVSITSSVMPGAKCLGAERYFMRMLTSLIDNATKYEPAGGAVHVTLRIEKRTVVISVTNVSTVLSEEDLPHVFDRYYRGESAGTDTGSFGLGLAIAHSMAEALGGSLEADNAPDAGARFTVRLPMAEE